MDFYTVGKKYNKGKVAHIYCEKNAPLNNIAIKGNCFLMIILVRGSITFSVGGTMQTALAPAFICFNEMENPFFRY